MNNNQPQIVLATKDGFNRYADFSGVSTRPQYWYFVLVTNPASIKLMGPIITGKANSGQFQINPGIISLTVRSITGLVPAGSK